MTTELDRLRAENARLRRYLEHISTYPPRVLDSDRVDDMQDLARAALSATKETT